MKRLGLALLGASILLVGCSSKPAPPIHSGTITGLRYDPAGLSNDPQHDCWRVTFTAKGQLAYDCIGQDDWSKLKVGQHYRAAGLADGEE